MVVWLFLAVPWVCLRFPDHTHLLYLPIKWPDKSFKENDIISMEKVVGPAVELSASTDEKYGLKTPFLLLNI